MSTEISLIIPTILNSGLIRLLDSIPVDDRLEVLLIGDSHDANFVDAFRLTELQYARANHRWLTFDAGYHCYGHPQRNYGMAVAEGDWLLFSQDDNVYLDGAIPCVFQAIAEQKSPRPLLFRVNTWQAGVVWRQQGRIAEGNLDADMIAVPNVPDKLAEWGDRYQGDADFIIQTCAKWNNDVDWREELIAVARPDEA